MNTTGDHGQKDAFLCNVKNSCDGLLSLWSFEVVVVEIWYFKVVFPLTSLHSKLVQCQPLE